MAMYDIRVVVMLAVGILSTLASVSTEGGDTQDHGYDKMEATLELSTLEFPFVMPLQSLICIFYSLVSWDFFAVVLLMIFLVKSSVKPIDEKIKLTDTQVDQLCVKVLQSVLKSMESVHAKVGRDDYVNSFCCSIDNNDNRKKDFDYGSCPDTCPPRFSTPVQSQEDYQMLIRGQPSLEAKLDQALNFLEDIRMSLDTMANGVDRVLAIWRHVEKTDMQFWSHAEEIMAKEDLGDRVSRSVRKDLVEELTSTDRDTGDNLLEDIVDHETTILDTSDSILIPESTDYDEVSENSFS